MENIDDSRTQLSLPSPVSGSIISLIGSSRAWVSRFLALVLLEGKRAGVSLAFMAGFGLAAGLLLVTGWLTLVAFAVVALVEHEIVGLLSALMIATSLSFAAAGGLSLLAIQRSKNLLFPASCRQLGLDSEPEVHPHE